MVALMQAALDEEARRKQEGRSDWSIPMRPDHGLNILDDQKRKAQPGYPAIGRLKGLPNCAASWWPCNMVSRPEGIWQMRQKGCIHKDNGSKLGRLLAALLLCGRASFLSLLILS